MQVKYKTAVTDASVPVSPMTNDDGRSIVMVYVRQDRPLDTSVICSILMAPDEARQFAARLVTAADDADAQMAPSMTRSEAIADVQKRHRQMLDELAEE